ncbi:hypothetical protein [Paenibacillus illinoisensis]|uniref:Uncharacterized protein n=1 Tax=Paenibacillus illinoisensis TaxID=59845 RepID=A0A2W0CC02_9BACL|nr:hypothetical protein [Paenibacillus illinoisensis]PYY28209.1 Uncharacterized protein PIL02S_03355 [Paenibacillus illinoisensis]
MRADNEFLAALINKLNDIAEKTNDIETEHELVEFIQVIVDSLE